MENHVIQFARRMISDLFANKKLPCSSSFSGIGAIKRGNELTIQPE